MGLLFLGESVDMVQIIGFIIIWVGLAVFSYGEYKVYKNDIKESSDDAAV
jgi:EamA domain-containing membrane protein RarD